MLESEIDNKYGCLFNEDTDLGHCIRLLPKYNERPYHWIKANDKNPTPTKSPDQYTACVSEPQGQSSSLSWLRMILYRMTPKSSYGILIR